MHRLILPLLLAFAACAAEKSPLVLNASNQPSVLTSADQIKLPAAGGFKTVLVPLAGADASIQYPASTTLAGLSLAQTWTAAQNFGTGTTVIATADINGGAIDGTAIGAASPSTVAATTLTTTGQATLNSDGTANENSLHLAVRTDITTATLPQHVALLIPATGTTSGIGWGVDNGSGANNGGVGGIAATRVSGTAYPSVVGRLTFVVQNEASSVSPLTIDPTVVTLSNGINLAMSGASTFTSGTGAVSLNGAVTCSSTLTMSTTSAEVITLGSGSGSSSAIGSSLGNLIKHQRYGYSTAYTAVQVGSSTRGIGFGIDPNTISGGQFNGNSTDFFFTRGTVFLVPNAGNTDWESALQISGGYGTANNPVVNIDATGLTLPATAAGNLIISAGDLIVTTATTPASAAATGTVGTIAWDADYIYVCTATDTWKRVAIATWP
jgi:hypothetical protein